MWAKGNSPTLLVVLGSTTMGNSVEFPQKVKNRTTMQSIRRRQWHPTPVLLPGKSHGQRSLEGCSPWSRYELDTTERLPFHFSLSCTGEGNGNPLQRSCLENPRDWGACWASIYGVAQSWTWLKRLSSSSSSMQSINSTPGYISEKNKNTNLERYMHPFINHNITYSSKDV